MVGKIDGYAALLVRGRDADPLANKCFADRILPPLPAHPAVLLDGTDLEGRGVVDGREGLGKRARTGLVAAAGHGEV